VGAERKAIDLRRQEGLAPWSPLPSETLAKRLNTRIIGPRDVGGLSEDKILVLLGTCSREWSAVTIRTEQGCHVVVENTTHSPLRRESTRFHELAHIICAHRPTGFQSIPGVGILLRSFDPEQEQEADWLGQCLHLPRPALGWCLNYEFSMEKISQTYVASEQLVRYRLNKTGLLIIRKRMAPMAH
jgi:Zn-dependent peptidase ImmA (M78 family)